MFINFVLPFSKNGVAVSSQSQATAILQKSRELIQKGSQGVAITYSANYGQTREIARTYFTGAWKTQIGGANQAAVMSAMETLLDDNYQDLQGKVHIAPITTMNAYDDPVRPWNDSVLMGIVTTDLDRLKLYLEAGWDVLGWQNQNTMQDPDRPYAVGGGIAKLPAAVSEKIQQTLIGYANLYAK